MSVEEEVELRDLVAQTLELNGCLPKIRAQLRANLFLALDEDSKISKQQPLLNTKIKSHLEVPEGQLMFCLVREFLEYFDLDFTASVYEPESYVGSFYKYEGRQKIIEDLGLKSTEDNFAGPILLHLVKIAQTKSKTLKINLTNINGDNQKMSNGSSIVSWIHDQDNRHSISESEENSINKSEEHPPLNVTHVIKKSNQIQENGQVLKDNFDSTFVKKDPENDDTFNGTSSIEEESVNGIDNNGESRMEEESTTSQKQDISPETKSKSEDKSKSQKSDKLKPKLELPPLQLNKSRGSDLLPSLYNKDFKEKLKEYDFEIKDDYEEDFMSGSEMELSQSKVQSPKPLFEELQQCSEYTSNPSNTTSKNKNFEQINKQSSHNSNSDNKLVNSNSSDNIETSLSVDEGSTNSNNT